MNHPVNKLAIGCRFFGNNTANIEKDRARLRAFLDAGQAVGQVYVAVNVQQDVTGAVDLITAEYPAVKAIPVTPWQKFVPALNAIVDAAMLDGNSRLLSVSAEFPVKAEYNEVLRGHLEPDTLGVAARFAEHVFQEGVRPATGASCPWNTYCLYNLVELSKFGIPLVGDAAFDRNQAGVEEMVTFAMYQALASATGFAAKAKLVTVPNFYGEWGTEGWDDKRKADHAKKIASKSDRPAKQLVFANLPAPIVHYIA